MAWKLEFDSAAERDLSQIDPPIARRIISSIEDGALRILVARIGNRREVFR